MRGDVVLVSPWDFQSDKRGDIIWRYKEIKPNGQERIDTRRLNNKKLAFIAYQAFLLCFLMKLSDRRNKEDSPIETILTTEAQAKEEAKATLETQAHITEATKELV